VSKQQPKEIAPKKQQPNEVARREDDSDVIEETETSSKASASVGGIRGSLGALQEALTRRLQAGLNLNVFGAIAGAFSSKSSKQTEDDGSTTETRQEKLAGKGIGQPEA
jgi:cytochrome c oxidase assembly protein subunit 15